jgi:AcrR family transcriptional regulator
VPVPVQPPQQERSRASFERVLEAGTELLEEEGWDGFTLAEVSRRAGVSIGSIYARVKSKDDLFHAIHERHVARIADEHVRLADLDEWRPLPTRTLVCDVVRELGEIFRSNDRILRVIMHRGIVDGVVAARSSAGASQFADWVERLLLERRKEIVHDDPDTAVDVAFRMAWATFARQIMYGPTFESRRFIEWDRLVDEVGSACATYLLGPA